MNALRCDHSVRGEVGWKGGLSEFGFAELCALTWSLDVVRFGVGRACERVWGNAPANSCMRTRVRISVELCRGRVLRSEGGRDRGRERERDEETRREVTCGFGTRTRTRTRTRVEVQAEQT
jgi:hypothetical protein